VSLDNPLFDAQPSNLGASRGFVVAAALAVGLLTGFAAGYLTSQKKQVATVAASTEEIPALAYTEDAVVEAPVPPPTAASGTTEGVPAEPVPAEPPREVPAALPAPVAAAPAPEPSPAARTARGPVRTPERADGTLFVFSRPTGADVYVDEQMAGTTPLSLASISAGTHRVRIALPGHRRWETAVAVPPGAAARVAASLER
jgi:hypothetical protein